MDNIKRDHSFNYMKPYHYVNFKKGEVVKDKSASNIISVLNKTIKELHNYKSYSKAEVKIKLCILFHLIGDLHQPLHVGYASDKGGNKCQVNYNGKGTNLHSLFDSGIIKSRKITVNDCVKYKYSKSEIKRIQKIDVIEWSNQSRSFLDEIYSIQGHKVSEEYVVKVEPIIKEQLYKAGLRLASVLEETFKS